MKSLISRDKVRRRQMMHEERVYLLRKAVLKDKRIDVVIRDYVRQTFTIKYRCGVRVRIKNYCLLTGHRRSVIRYFRMSRMQLKKLGLIGEIVGFKKASW